MSTIHDKWFEKAVVYQVYPKSFQDTDDDGIGDLKGILKRMDYIQSLGVNMIWLNPVFVSPQVDNGYDVANYYAIDDLFGTMADMEKLIEEAHKRGIKVMLDFVLNHTSDQHPWFQEALKGPENRYRDYYIWHEAVHGQSIPNNWGSFFGGSVWEKESRSDSFYFHLFAKEMPDLNWENPEVRLAMADSAEFWLDKGIDALRLDAFIHVAKEGGFPDVSPANKGEIVLAENYYANLPKVIDYMNEFNQRVRKNHPTVFLVGEAASASVELAKKYTDPINKVCDSVITFRYFPETEELKDKRLPLNRQHGKLDLKKFKLTMAEWQKELAEVGGPVLYWNNHDMARAVSRFGDDEHHRDNSSKMLATLMYLQKGIPFLLNGEEIGMKNLTIKAIENFSLPGADLFYQMALDLGHSKEFALEHLNARSKDVSRGVMQWDDTKYAGFSAHLPWSGVNREEKYNVLDQETDVTSVLHYYRAVLKLKKEPLFIKGALQLMATSLETYCYERHWEAAKALVCCNLSEKTQVVSIKGWINQPYTVALTNQGNTLQKETVTLSPYGAMVILM
ncbi:alpha-glucosidase [Carnobacterium pleistocenium]|uniref:alpha-glucosidase n=1 Tax=Carnobacterium pleistocenium TaxID=181073 RepID=UPI00054D9089|nr:alpha-glucosidase [Carnobacterium pleistocenium]